MISGVNMPRARSGTSCWAEMRRRPVVTWYSGVRLCPSTDHLPFFSTASSRTTGWPPSTPSAKGYGYSDMAKRTPVTPDTTLFRPGSTSKLFTWTSVMQLVEQGKLDLNRDVNDYLDFKIPPAFGKPITLRNIMTHTAGFEEVVKDLFVADAEHMGSLEYYVKNHIPERI